MDHLFILKHNGQNMSLFVFQTFVSLYLVSLLDFFKLEDVEVDMCTHSLPAFLSFNIFMSLRQRPV